MRLSASKFFGIAFAILVAFLGLAYAVGESSRQPVGMLLPTTAIGGFIAFAVVGVLSNRMKRPFGLIDGLRCTGWMLIGSSIGLQQIAGSYYRYYWPQYAPFAIKGSLAGVIAGALMIVIPSVVLNAPEEPREGCCKQCGYDLTGNISGTCPECGAKS